LATLVIDRSASSQNLFEAFLLKLQVEHPGGPNVVGTGREGAGLFADLGFYIWSLDKRMQSIEEKAGLPGAAIFRKPRPMWQGQAGQQPPPGPAGRRMPPGVEMVPPPPGMKPPGSGPRYPPSVPPPPGWRQGGDGPDPLPAVELSAVFYATPLGIEPERIGKLDNVFHDNKVRFIKAMYRWRGEATSSVMEEMAEDADAEDERDPSKVIIDAIRIFSSPVSRLLEEVIPGKGTLDRNLKTLFKRPFRPLIRGMEDIRREVQQERHRMQVLGADSCSPADQISLGIILQTFHRDCRTMNISLVFSTSI
jgi:hypothetical protein